MDKARVHGRAGDTEAMAADAAAVNKKVAMEGVKGKPAGAMEKLEMRASLARLAALCKAADDWERDIIHQYQTNGFAELAEDSDEEA